ncbi:MAG: type II toxin-antitoxin system RelE/ParE family toxin [Candidatus Paceibacterota bacterium]
MWKVYITPQAKETLNKLDTAVCERIEKKLRWLAENVDSVNHERLSGNYSDFFKLRVGDYRVLYRLRPESNLIRVDAAGHRSEIYDS